LNYTRSRNLAKEVSLKRKGKYSISISVCKAEIP